MSAPLPPTVSGPSAPAGDVSDDAGEAAPALDDAVRDDAALDDAGLGGAADGEATPGLEAVLARLGRRLLVPLLLALVAVAALAFYADGRELARRLGEFDLALLVPVLALSLVNYALRFVRWHLYLLRVDASPGWVDSLFVFLFGFVLTVTPGKVGELGKAWLVRELGGGRGRDGIATVMAERITDIAGALVLICLGTLAFPGLAVVAWTGLGVTLTLTALLAWPRSVDLLAALLVRIPYLRDRARILLEMHHSLGRLLRPGLLVGALMLSIVAWGAEGLGFALIVGSYTGETAWLAGLFDYSVGSMAGGLAMLPGGLVAAEGTLTALLVARGVDAAAAASATLIVRAATLWFAFLLGLGAMPLVWMRLRRRRTAERGSG